MEGLDGVSFCKGLRGMGKKMSLVQQLLLCLLGTICFSFHMLAIRLWYVLLFECSPGVCIDPFYMKVGI